ncbi:glycosyltransferase family 9 protein [Marinomonas epiphytica]
MLEEKLQRIAIVRLSALGDVCHAMLVVQALEKRYPNAQITWICGPLEANLVRLMPNIEVIEYDKKTGLTGMLAIRKQLKSVRFDVLLHLQWSLRASLLTKMLRAKRRIGFALTHSREKQHWFVNELAEEPKGMHVLDSFLSITAKLGVDTVHTPCQLELAPTSLDLPNTYFVINPSASKAERNWTLDGYRAVIDQLTSKGHQVVLTGGPSSQEVALAEQLVQGFELINLVGKTSVNDLCHVIKGAKLVVSPDTGPVHLATLLDVPVIGLYAHSNPRRTGPYKDLDKVVSVYDELAEKEYAKPVSELPWAARVHDPKAMQLISKEAVLAQLDRFI